MKFSFFLALRNLIRYPARNILYILGISITAALLLDMILLSSGLSLSLERVLKDMRYDIRASARGTLPFETETQIKNFYQLKKELMTSPEIETVDGLLGTTLGLRFANENFTCFGLGLQLDHPSGYKIISGNDIHDVSKEVLVNSYLAEAKKIKPGDMLSIWVPGQSQTAMGEEPVPVRVSGIASFYLDAEGQFSIACSLSFLQELLHQQTEEPISAILIRLRDRSKAEEIAEQINSRFPQVTAYTIASVIQEVDKQLSYFKQFAYILGGISLVVTFVLVFIITTISFHDRLGEIALLKAIGLSSKTIFSTVLLEGLLTSIASTLFGFFLGKIVAIYLDRILTSAPGLPEHFSFFVLNPPALLQGIIVLLLTGLFAGIYPAAAAVRLPIAETLREEIL
jgi:putative ABC transport system permease protein